MGLAVGMVLGGCSLAPREAEREREAMQAAGAVYEAPAPRRLLADLPPEPSWRDVLRHAFLSNGELEAAFFAWQAAVERIDVAAGYPNANVSIGFEYLFSGGNLTGWDRTSLSAGVDPMQNLSFPTKVIAAGRVATADARAAGERFAAAKFALQRQVLEAWLDYALQAEQVRLQRQQLDLLRLGADGAAARVRGGMAQDGLLAAQVEHGHGAHELLELEARLPAARARLNALIGRGADAPLPPPAALPEPRPLPDDAALLAAGTRANPELAALARDAAGRADALDLAWQQYFPDINPFVGLAGSMEQVAGAAIILATTVPQIQAGIREARANLRASEALRRQGGLDRDAAFVAALLALRSSERQLALLDDHIAPAADAAVAAAERAYAAGGGDLDGLLAAAGQQLELRLAIAETRIARERLVAEIESLAGVDAELLATLAAPGGAERGALTPALSRKSCGRGGPEGGGS